MKKLTEDLPLKKRAFAHLGKSKCENEGCGLELGGGWGSASFDRHKKLCDRRTPGERERAKARKAARNSRL